MTVTLWGAELSIPTKYLILEIVLKISCLSEVILPELFTFCLQSLEEIQDYCQENFVPHIVILKDIETGTLRVQSWEKER
jgi:hypothetical protein